ncbi:S8 family peptidase [Clostridium psychrophilum]|uniref:S8 family peptidase n=1 Tax=Clostridium psychrophilum TaxID=132926 RepID=UPI001C0ADD3F|nr:S8 family serine peptidase [Clostridium psychrophilum]MBU3182883.1 S8 family serine peptidase [Clostridium psychrophilum]
MNVIVSITLVIVVLLCSLIGRMYNFGEKFPKVKIVLNISLVIVVLIALFTIFFDSGVNKDKGWAIDYMNYKSIHKLSKGKSQKIALIDTGISKFQINNDEKSIALVGNEYDNNGHGTILYSIIKGYGYGNEIEGIAPNTEIFSIKVMDIDNPIKSSIIAQAINKAIDAKCTIINISIGGYKYNDGISKAIDKAMAKGITVISSSGDYKTVEMLFPANKKGVISVGASSSNFKTWDFTNAPDKCTIIAPGDEIKGIDNTKKIDSTSGTSQATAIISGYVALLKDYAYQNNVKLTNEKIISLLKSINNKTYNYVELFNQLH